VEATALEKSLLWSSVNASRSISGLLRHDIFCGNPVLGGSAPTKTRHQWGGIDEPHAEAGGWVHWRPYSKTPVAMSDSSPAPLERQYGPRELALTLAWLRGCAIVGQALTVLIVAHALSLAIPETALLAGIGVLGAFALFAWWRLQQPWPVGEAEVVGHLAVDTGVLSILLYLTGGATNPFVSLYIVPVALAATALSARYLACAASLACGAYLALLLWHVPLPDAFQHSAHARGTAFFSGGDFDLHVLGMAVNFAITTVLLGFFIWRLARRLRARETSMQRERERALRDEGILAIATQAAGAAHELNTPLSTIRTLLAELRREHAGATPLRDDLDLLSSQAERCRDILRELVAVGAAHLGDNEKILSVEAFISDCADRFRLLRPTINLEVAIDDVVRALPLRVAPDLRHALINLLNNAADASHLRQSTQVNFYAKRVAAQIEFGIRDFGPGLTSAARQAAGLRFFTSKRDGLGIGLALTNATAERLGGRLGAQSASGGGTLTRLRLPLLSEDNAAHD
jgi:two-component system, sensor histidine kinase RegB